MSHYHGKTKKATPNLFHSLAWDLKAALRKEGCPICRVVAEDLEGRKVFAEWIENW